MSSKKLGLLVFLAVLVFAALVGYGDFREMGQRLADFPVTHLIAALALALLNYLLRFVRWAFYLRVLKFSGPLAVSGLVFLSGLAMSVTPGKAGELLKSYLLRDRVGVPVSVSAPVVVMERITDVLSVVLLGLLGLALLPQPVVVALLAALSICGGALVVVASRRSGSLLGLPLVRRWKSNLETSHQGLRILTVPRVVAVAVALGVVAWFCEGLAMWVILRGLDADQSLVGAVSIYAAATLVGAVSAMPGGLVGTEGSMVALLQNSGIARGPAAAGTLLVRLVTLWLAVAIGLIALVCLNRSRRSRLIPASMEPESPSLEPESTSLPSHSQARAP